MWEAISGIIVKIYENDQEQPKQIEKKKKSLEDWCYLFSRIIIEVK